MTARRYAWVMVVLALAVAAPGFPLLADRPDVVVAGVPLPVLWSIGCVVASFAALVAYDRSR